MSNVTKTVKSSGGDYTSLNAALSGMSGDLTADCGGTGTAGILTIECYAISGGDTTPASTGTGYTVSADYYINITVPISDRHSGKWNDDKYYLNYNNALTISESYTRVSWLQGALGSSGFFAESAADAVTFNGLIVKPNTGTPNYGIRFDGANSSTGTVRNCIVYGGFARGITLYYGGAGRTLSVYNCTVSGCGTAGIADRQGSHVVATNCAVFNNADDFAGTFSSITYCASDDGDGTNAVNISPGATEADDWANAFVDYANGDFHVRDTSSVLYNTASDLSATFTDDIDGDTRSQWDIGADEYVASGASIPLSNPFSRPFSQSLGRGGF